MDIKGEQRIALPQERVWQALNDPEVLRQCIPGCEAVERVSDTEYKVIMTAAIGPVKAKFNGKLLLSDVQPPNAYTLHFEGSGGVAGFGKGTSTVKLSPEAQGTLLNYDAKAQVGGRLAQVGSRLIDGVARNMTEEFFSRFNAVATAPPAPPYAAAAMATSASGMGAVITWLVIIAVLMAAILGFVASR